MYKDDDSQKFLTDPKVKSLFANAKTFKDVDTEKYAAIFYVGGHGPVIDLAFDQANIEMAIKVSSISRLDLFV